MSELISGKEALIAIANGEDVQIRFKTIPTIGWCSLDTVMIQSIEKIMNGCDDFRIKPKTISINGIEVPATFKPKEGEVMYVLDNNGANSFYRTHFNLDSELHENFLQFGAWRTEEEIKQVVEALRSVFK